MSIPLVIVHGRREAVLIALDGVLFGLIVSRLVIYLLTPRKARR